MVCNAILCCLSILNCSYTTMYVIGTHKLYIIELPSGLEYTNNFLSAYDGNYNSPVIIETRVKGILYNKPLSYCWMPDLESQKWWVKKLACQALPTHPVFNPTSFYRQKKIVKAHLSSSWLFLSVHTCIYLSNFKWLLFGFLWLWRFDRVVLALCTALEIIIKLVHITAVLY